MPGKKGQRLGRQKKNLTTFGEWLYELCEYLGGVSITTLAERANLSESTLSKVTRLEDGLERLPSKETLIQLYEALKAIASEKEVFWCPTFRQSLWWAAGWATEENRQQSAHELRSFRRTHSSKASQPNTEEKQQLLDD